ncbi:INO80 complex subunit Ies4 [Penicillium fimorum]|uniref:INO80 complex subunit Ies4 n=1 Tax=Penicillium fimorum TaxID=1882269 RepID=A0A9W9XPF1_9EURO|nr:INO80 complex subunit Ies4 [Penicillium fimorum]
MPAATPNGRSRAKNSSNSLMVVLKLSEDSLRQFTSPNIKSIQNNTPNIKTNDNSSPASSTELPTVRPSSADNGSDADANSTPATGVTPSDAQRRKGVPGPKPGNKRTKEQTDSTAKSRGRPGPKKKPRLEEGDATKIPAAQRLGPKANTGAINAGLRALDRTGAACRKWERKPLQLRSFTGIMWQLPSWRTPGISKSDDSVDGKSAALESDHSDSKTVLHAPGTDTANGSSAVPSEKSHSGDGDVTPAPSHLVEPSSPAIAMTA